MTNTLPPPTVIASPAAAKPSSVTTVTATIEPTASSTITSTTTTATLKPGIKTSEGILTMVSIVLSGAYAVGLVGVGDSVWSKVVGLAAVTLTTMGYQVSRALAKAGQ